jgi:ribosomal protein L14E/L6E/L27E
MDTIFEFPDQVVRAPKNYKLPKGKSLEEVKKELEELHRKLAKEMTITYIRSNGKEQTLTLEEIFKRREAFEMSYNPNDCVEVRWGAPAGSEELSSCRRRAPASQQEKMKSMRQWFHKRHYPLG